MVVVVSKRSILVIVMTFFAINYDLFAVPYDLLVIT